ncbi:MAG: phosphoribosylanthranilate isomerase [Verrucomicrobiota bacterium]|nr:phosphoribosylanthranilate isomerase [Verrucomicrobiota bacterium]
MVRVKVCGITSLVDAVAAIDAGADALGFMFYEGSSRYINPADARSIIKELPPFISSVGVFVNLSITGIREIAAKTGIDTVQLHGEEAPDFCSHIPLPVIKAFRVESESIIVETQRFPNASALLLDSYVPGRLGGTGATFNWDLAVQAKQNGKPIILAGGLTPLNVGEAVQKVRPFAVDVSSGVESAPGKKDQAKMRDFISSVRTASGH